MTSMDVEATPLNFPSTFCCNCGDTNCRSENQDTRLSGWFSSSSANTTFQLSIPVCAACIRSTRRRPPNLVSQFLTWLLVAVLVSGALFWLASSFVLPLWFSDYLLGFAGGITLILRLLFDRLRRPRPMQTSFHQPVRVRRAEVRFAGDRGQLTALKLGFTNHEYLNVFTTANRDAIQSGWLAAVKA